MPDAADLADQQIQRNLDAAIAAARAIQAPETDHCSVCGEPLLTHRREFGTCVDCSRDLERMARMGPVVL